jgi:hypothetical protein
MVFKTVHVEGMMLLPLFLQLAPVYLPSFDPDMIWSGEARLLLAEYLFPESFGCSLEAFKKIRQAGVPEDIHNIQYGPWVPLLYVDSYWRGGFSHQACGVLANIVFERVPRLFFFR